MMNWFDKDAVAADVPLASWCADIEIGAQDQIRNLARLPFAFHHIAVMPDCHVGYGMPIGGVMATTDAIVPNAVGVDIACGMRAWPLHVTKDEFMPVRDKVMNQIQRAIPTGCNHHKTAQADWTSVAQMAPVIDRSPDGRLPIVNREYEASLKQVGTLGGGNHFIEAQAAADGTVWFMLHSGSRNIGLQVAKHYNKLAIDLNAHWHASVPQEWELAFLPWDSDEGRTYFAEMSACMLFARANREHMMRAIIEVLDREGITCGEPLDVHHNYAALENHYGKNVIVHRKGAVRAREGERVIIPGSMGSASYLATGLGNQASFQSCSHGAGRAMGRKAATREITAESVILEMRARDISLFKAKKADVAEECRQAYKDVEAVMAAQSDLVADLYRLEPLAVIKA